MADDATGPVIRFPKPEDGKEIMSPAQLAAYLKTIYYLDNNVVDGRPKYSIIKGIIYLTERGFYGTG